MFDETWWSLLRSWRTLSGRRWLQLALPAVLTLDMVHNVYIVASEWKQRVKSWKEEDERRVAGTVSAVLRNIACHCSVKNADVWPAPVAAHLGLSSSEADARELPMKAEEQLQTLDHLELDAFSWLILTEKDRQEAAAERKAAGTVPAAAEPVAEPNNFERAVQKAAAPWQRRLESASGVYRTMHDYAASKFHWLHSAEAGFRLNAAQGRNGEHSTGSPDSHEDQPTAGLPDLSDGTPLTAEDAEIDDSSRNSSSSKHKQRLSAAKMPAIGVWAEAKLDEWGDAFRDRYPVPRAQVSRRSAIRFSVAFHGIVWPEREPAGGETDWTDL